MITQQNNGRVHNVTRMVITFLSKARRVCTSATKIGMSYGPVVAKTAAATAGLCSRAMQTDTHLIKLRGKLQRLDRVSALMEVEIGKVRERDHTTKIIWKLSFCLKLLEWNFRMDNTWCSSSSTPVFSYTLFINLIINDRDKVKVHDPNKHNDDRKKDLLIFNLQHLLLLYIFSWDDQSQLDQSYHMPNTLLFQ